MNVHHTTRNAPPPATPVNPPSPAISAELSENDGLHPLLKKHFAMGTVFEVVAYEADPARASAAIAQAFEEIDRLELVMSRYNPASELNRLNRSAHGQAHGRAHALSPDLYQVMQQALLYSELSQGAFDVTAGALAERWKAVGRGQPVPSPAEQQRLRRGVGYRRVELIPPNRIRFHSSGVQVDLGAIGKGYAVDRAAAVLRRCGVRRALINCGGSTFYAMDAPPRQAGWRVHLRDPSGHFGPYVFLRENSVSTSEQTPPSLLGMCSFGHIVDTGAGVPAKTTVAVSVVAETATASDALSTALLLLGPQKGRELVTNLPNVAAIWVSPQGLRETSTTGPEILLRPAPVEGI